MSTLAPFLVAARHTRIPKPRQLNVPVRVVMNEQFGVVKCGTIGVEAAMADTLHTLGPHMHD